VAHRDVAVQGVMRAGLVGEQVGDHAAPRQLGQGLGARWVDGALDGAFVAGEFGEGVGTGAIGDEGAG
jgi:hypothetical protein